MPASGGHCDYCTLTVEICGEVGHSTHGLPRRQPALLGDPVDLVGDAVDSANMMVMCPRRVSLSFAGLPDWVLHRGSGWCHAWSVVRSGWLVEMGGE
jgi:hypothetical protein